MNRLKWNNLKFQNVQKFRCLKVFIKILKMFSKQLQLLSTSLLASIFYYTQSNVIIQTKIQEKKLFNLDKNNYIFTFFLEFVVSRINLKYNKIWKQEIKSSN